MRSTNVMATVIPLVAILGASADGRADILHEPYSWQVAGNFLKKKSKPTPTGFVKRLPRGGMQRLWAAKVTLRPRLKQVEFKDGRATYVAEVAFKGKRYQRRFSQGKRYPQTLVPSSRGWRKIGPTPFRARVSRIARAVRRPLKQGMWFMRPKK